MDKDRYTVTVYAAAPGTPLTQEKDPAATSTPGHMYYTTQKNGEPQQSYGFAPVKHGSIDGPGHVVRDDVVNYKDPLYSRTMEVSKEQYEKLNDYGNHPKENGFDTYYEATVARPLPYRETCRALMGLTGRSRRCKPLTRSIRR